MQIPKRLLNQLFKDSLWLLLLAGVLAFALVRIERGIALAFVPLILYWGLHWAAYFLGMAIKKGISKIDKQLIDAERGRDISKFTYRTFLVGMWVSASCLVIAGFEQSWWVYVMMAGVFIWGMGLGMMFSRFITHTEVEEEPMVQSEKGKS